jgi:hypothetical protein
MKKILIFVSLFLMVGNVAQAGYYYTIVSPNSCANGQGSVVSQYYVDDNGRTSFLGSYCTL